MEDTTLIQGIYVPASWELPKLPTGAKRMVEWWERRTWKRTIKEAISKLEETKRHIDKVIGDIRTIAASPPGAYMDTLATADDTLRWATKLCYIARVTMFVQVCLMTEQCRRGGPSSDTADM